MGYVCTFNQPVAASYLIVWWKLFKKWSLPFDQREGVFYNWCWYLCCSFGTFQLYEAKTSKDPKSSEGNVPHGLGCKRRVKVKDIRERETEREREGGGYMAHNQQNAQWKLIILNKTRSVKVNVNERTSVINSSPEYVHPLKEVVGLHMTEAIKAGWLTGSSDLWRQQTHQRLFLSASVFGRKGEAVSHRGNKMSST